MPAGRRKTHHTTGKIPLRELEKEGLQELPPQETLDKYRWETRIVTRDGMVSFDGVRYGVPWQYSGLAEKNGVPVPPSRVPASRTAPWKFVS